MPVIMHEEGGCKDVTSTRRINFMGRIGRKAFCDAVLEEGSAVSSIRGDEQRHLHTPMGEHSIGIGTITIGEWEQVIVAKYEDVK